MGLFAIFTIGDLTIIDALFLAGLGYFLYRALRGLPAGREFTPAASRVIAGSGIALSCMFVLKMLFSICVTEVFKAKTQGLFQLAYPAGNTLYVVAGLLLTLCANFLRRGQQLQQEADLTI